MNARAISSFSAVVVMALGVSTMAGGLFGLRAIVQPYSAFAPIQFNTALCLTLAGLALLHDDRAWRAVTIGAAGLLMAISGLTAIQYLFGINLGIDQLIVDARFATAPTLLPGRMSQQTASAALLVSGIVLASTRGDSKRSAAILGVGGCVVGCYAVTSALGYPSAITHTSSWLGFTRVSPQASAGFFLIASGLIARAYARKEERGLPEWVVPAVVTTSWIIGLLLFIGLRQLENADTYSTLPHITLIAFLLLGLALGVALVQYRRATLAGESAIAGKARIESLLARMVRSELVASLALEHTQQGVWDLNLATRTTTVDDGFRKILGRAPQVEPMVDDTWMRAIHPDDIDRVRTSIRANMAGGDLFEAQFRARTAGGSWIWLDSRGRVVDRDASGVALRMVGTIRDITEQQRSREKLQQAEEALRDAQRKESIGRLAGGVAHHINNLMMVVLGRSDMLATMSTTPRQRATVDAISQAATETANICRQLLAHAQRQFLRPIAFDADALIADLFPSLETALGPGIRLAPSLHSSQERCHADPSQIEWVIRNLIDNAHDALGTGGEVRITTTVVEYPIDSVPAGVTPGRYVSIGVSDNGTGMTAEAMAHLFEPFFTTKNVGEAQGLGLATCYGILKQSKGHLSVESQPGSGTTFTLLLPCATRAN